MISSLDPGLSGSQIGLQGYTTAYLLMDRTRRVHGYTNAVDRTLYDGSRMGHSISQLSEVIDNTDYGIRGVQRSGGWAELGAAQQLAEVDGINITIAT